MRNTNNCKQYNKSITIGRPGKDQEFGLFF